MKLISSEVAYKERIPPPDAADSKCPMFAFSDELLIEASDKALIVAPTSMGSPREVPVP